MSNVQLIIEERAANIGDFLVGRLLPFRQKRSVGPFVFIDHMGPANLLEGENLDVAAHPHIGLSTLTYLFEGAVFHRDSIGTEIEISAGDVGWMTAGRGIVHSERTPERLRLTNKKLHGMQIWVALPKEKEQIEPSFFYVKETELPQWVEQNCRFKLIAGEAIGHVSPIPVHSKLYLIEVKSSERTTIKLNNKLYGESALYILDGAITINDQKHTNQQILVAKNSSICELTLETSTTIYIFGGFPFPEPRYIDWNFVSSDKNLLQQARNDWKNQLFPKIKNEREYIPLPNYLH